MKPDEDPIALCLVPHHPWRDDGLLGKRREGQQEVSHGLTNVEPANANTNQFGTSDIAGPFYTFLIPRCNLGFTPNSKMNRGRCRGLSVGFVPVSSLLRRLNEYLSLLGL